MSLVINKINTERFIDEIKFRPCLWDSSSESYKDREQKKVKWTEMCALFHPNFEDFTPKEKSEICKGLQGKWKNIRDCYRKYLKSLETKSGQARKQVKTYLYAAQLSFLQSTVLLGPTEPSPNVEQGECVQHNKESDDFVDEGDNTAERPHSSSTIYRRKKKCLEAKLEKYIDSINESQGYAKEEDCDDLNFFKSLVPIVKPLPMSDKIKFRMEVMKLTYDYSINNQQQPISQYLVRTTDSLTAPPTLQPLFVNTVPEGSSTFGTTPTGKAPRPTQKKLQLASPSPSAFGVMQSAWKRLREHEGDSSEFDSPGANSVGSFLESDSFFF